MSDDPRPARRAAVLAELHRRRMDCLVVTRASSVRYLTGYVGSNGIAVIGSEGSALLTDFRYRTSAAQQIDEGVQLVMRQQDLIGGVPEVAAGLAGGGKVGLEAEHISLQAGERLRGMLTRHGPELTSGIVEDVRVVKDEGEVELIRRSAAITDAALADVVAAGLVGRTERQVAWDLQAALNAHGAEGPSFDIIVAAGPNSAKPHAVPGDAVIPADTMLTIDMGGIFSGYCSDMTRTFWLGTPDPQLVEAYAVCERAQLASLAAVRPGALCADVDAVARDIIDQAGFGPNFGHGLGHGVGLDIHEAPRLGREAPGELRPGMIVTVEPGIYLEDVGGMRIEDLVVVTEDGCEILSAYPKDPRAAG